MSILSAFFIALVVSTAATAAVRELARRFGFIARPTSDRWHRRPTALLGGIAVFVATAAVAAFSGPLPQPLPALGAAAAFMFAVGLADDVVKLRPATKLALQIAAASVAVWGGVHLGWTRSLTLDALVTIFWLIGVTNAFNLIDNMDGACAGVGAIAAGTIAALGTMNAPAGATAAWAVALGGGLIGFLFFNFHPASIFLGDSGSLFVGFLLGGLVAASGAQQNAPYAAVMLPVLVLAVPIFDTTLVTLARKLSRRPASQGGTDHTAHRLVALGFSEVKAVLFLYLLAALCGVAAVVLKQPLSSGAEIFVVALLLGLVLLAAALLRVRVYGGRDYSLVLEERIPLVVVEFLVRHNLFELLLDLVLVAGAYYTAYRIRFDAAHFPAFFPAFLRTLPIVIACQILSLRISGAYGLIWRYFSTTDLVTLGRGVAMGTASASVLLVYLYRFENLSRGVFIIYAVLLMTLLAGSRMFFRLLPAIGSGPAAGRRPALAYGAGDAGEMLVRELDNNSRHGYQVVAFLDDDRLKAGRRVRGIPVVGGVASLPAQIARRRPQAVILSSTGLPVEIVGAVDEVCRRADIPLLQFRCVLEPPGAPAAGMDPVGGLEEHV